MTQVSTWISYSDVEGLPLNSGFQIQFMHACRPFFWKSSCLNSFKLWCEWMQGDQQKDFSLPLHRPSAQISSSNELSDWPVQAVLKHGCPKRGQTCLSEQMNLPGDCLDKSSRHLIRQPCPRTAWTGWSQDSLALLVWANNWCSVCITASLRPRSP